jgi:hypothetical protein
MVSSFESIFGNGNSNRKSQLEDVLNIDKTAIKFITF